MSGRSRWSWLPSPVNKSCDIRWTCGTCGHEALFESSETVYEDDDRYCEHGPKQPRNADGTLRYAPHSAEAIIGIVGDKTPRGCLP